MGLAHAAVAQDDRQGLSMDFHCRARERFRDAMKDSAIAVIAAAPIKNRINDVNYLYRQDNALYYLCGIKEPNAILVLAKQPIKLDSIETTEMLFVEPRNAREERWTGRKLGAAGAKKTLGIAVALERESALSDVRKIIEANKNRLKRVYLNLPLSQRSEDALLGSTAVERHRVETITNRLRVSKDPEELALIKRATEISMEAQTEAIMSCEPQMYEYQLGATAEFIFKKNGCEYTAYPPIVGAGENSVILHYETLRKKMLDGELVVMDMAGEFRGYASDLTRTIPVNGKFTPEQRAIYELVLAAQDSAIKQCRVGASFVAPHRKAVEVIAEGLMKLGLIKERNDYSQYFMHGTSHHVGLDVHDPSSATLGENQVITVEPGIYISEGSPCDRKWWNIGVRIEDVVLITKSGYVVLSGALPKTVAEIEALMEKKGVGNVSRK
jgi:Xaa-Pro aminopeptidase